jgi:hydrogenase/urease accessory protein HupE
MSKRLVRALLAVLTCTGASVALAHTSGTTYLTVDRTTESRRLISDQPLLDLNYELGLDRNADGQLTFDEIDRASARIGALLQHRLRVRSGTGECTGRVSGPLQIADYAEGRYARLEMTLACSGGPLALDYTAGFRADPLHRVIISAGGTPAVMLTADTPTWHEAETPRQVAVRFLVQGVWHLVTGYDHLAFLLVLLIAAARPAGGSPRSLRAALLEAAKVVTGFTIAHSLTLGLAATGVVRLPPAPIEVAIAASVVIAALANLRQRSRLNGWHVAAAFGLIHGLGFASALAELLGSPPALLAIGTFNLGIEIAQLTIAAVLIPLLWWSFRWRPMARWGVPVMSIAVAAVALGWVLERLP